MSFIKILSTSLAIGLIGCSSDPRDHDAGCESIDPVCLGMIAAKSYDYYTSDKKCSEMIGKQKKQCDDQVESLKKHIRDATNK